MANRKNDDDIGKKFPYRFFSLIGVIVTLAGIGILFNLQSFIEQASNIMSCDEMSGRGQYGEFIAGVVGAVFSLVGVVFLFTTFKQQNDSFQRERFENQFFEMMKIYRENVDEMHYLPPDEDDKNSFQEGRKVFVKINREILRAFRLIRRFATRTAVSFDEVDVISIANLTVFFGLSNEGATMLSNYFKKHGYDRKYPTVIKYIFTTLRRERAQYAGAANIKYYGGHQIRLGHYFRHLFQTVLFVHSQEFLTRQEKYNYVKLLRGQMSTYEQAVFFYNAVCPMGYVWELKYRDLNYNFKINPKTKLRYEVDGREVTKQDLLITEYRLIQNVPDGFTSTINPRSYFKELVFEGDEDDEH